MINKELAEELGLEAYTIRAIEDLHKYRADIFRISEQCTRDGLQRELYKEWMSVERQLQDLWGFDKDDDKIKFWNFPACSCPKMDNEDRYPYGYYIVNGGCIIHGDKVNSKDLTPEDIASVKGILSDEDADNREWIMSDEEAEEFYHRKIAGE